MLHTGYIKENITIVIVIAVSLLHFYYHSIVLMTEELGRHLFS